MQEGIKKSNIQKIIVVFITFVLNGLTTTKQHDFCNVIVCHVILTVVAAVWFILVILFFGPFKYGRGPVQRVSSIGHNDPSKYITLNQRSVALQQLAMWRRHATGTLFVDFLLNCVCKH